MQPSKGKPRVVKNCNTKEWYLEVKIFDFEKGSHIRTYGWITKTDYGMYRVVKPAPYNPETDSDAEMVGIYNNFFKALHHLWKANNPNFSLTYIGI